MDISISDLGPVGAMKTLVNTAIVMAAAGMVLTWPKDFDGPGELAALAAGVFVLCGVVEWIFRAWHKEQAEAIRAAQVQMKTDIARTDSNAREQAARIPYARNRLLLCERALIEHNQAVMQNMSQLSVETFSLDRLEAIRAKVNDPSYDPTLDPQLVRRRNE